MKLSSPMWLMLDELKSAGWEGMSVAGRRYRTLEALVKRGFVFLVPDSYLACKPGQPLYLVYLSEKGRELLQKKLGTRVRKS